MGVIDEIKNKVRAVGKVKSVFGGRNEQQMTREQVKQVVRETRQEEEEPEFEEYETYYQLAKDYLQEAGFSSIGEFTERAMYHFVQETRSDMNVLETGMNTLSQLSSARDELRNIRGEESSNLDEIASRARKASEAKEHIKKLKGEDEQLKRDALKLGRLGIGLLARRGSSPETEVEE